MTPREHLENPDAVNHLGRLLHANLTFSPAPLVPADEVEVRLEKARQIQSLMLAGFDDVEWRLTNYHLASILVLPRSMLDTFYRCDPLFGSCEFEYQLKHISWAIKHFAQAPRLHRSGDSGTGSSQEEARKCEERDGNRCLLTGALFSEACHILPFIWTASERNAAVAGELKASYGYITGSGYGFKIIPHLRLFRTVKGTDKWWNMICLDPRLHDLWGKCYWGFKWLHKSAVEGDLNLMKAVLQFRWLPRSKRRPEAAIDLDGIEDTLHKVRDFDDRPMSFDDQGVYELPDFLAAFSIQSGHTVDVTLPAADMDKFEIMVRVQWGLVQMGAISGAAEHGANTGDFDRFMDMAMAQVEGRIRSGGMELPVYLDVNLGQGVRIRDDEARRA